MGHQKVLCQFYPQEQQAILRMKVLNSVVFATFAAAQDDQDLRGLSPEKRLAKLQNNFQSWLGENLTPLGDKVINRWQRHVSKIGENMLKAYNRPQCGFYDSSIKHGGPDPEPELRPNGKPRRPLRRRRDVDDKLKYDKTNPIKGIRQILDGFRVWSERHINECSGQRKSQFIANRMQTWLRKLGTRYEQTF